MILLAIETTSRQGSLALFKENELVEQLYIPEKFTSGDALLSWTRTLLEKQAIRAVEIDAIAVGIGPGTYTGTRVGVTAAKSLAYGLRIPVLGMHSLPVLAAGVSLAAPADVPDSPSSAAGTSLVATALDGRQDFLFGGLYEVSRSDGADRGGPVRLTTPRQILPQCVDHSDALWTIISKRMISRRLSGADASTLLVIGDGADRLIETASRSRGLSPPMTLQRGAATLDRPCARTLGLLAATRLRSIEWDLETVHSLEPLYLRATEAERRLMNKLTESKH